MVKYLALLRGVNVGGKSLLKMADLKGGLEQAGFAAVRTYIQSGNVLFDSGEKDKAKLASDIKAVIKDRFGVDTDVALFTAEEWRGVIDQAPEWWGRDEGWKHNLLILIKPYDIKRIMADIGALKPDIEKVEAGKGVVYQSLLFVKFGQTSSGKLAGTPSYKRMTIRNFNTARKLGDLLEAS